MSTVAGRRLLASIACLVLVLLVGCARSWQPATAAVATPKRQASQPQRDPASFLLHRRDLRAQGGSAALISALEQSRLRYFRMLAGAFEHRTCAAFRRRGHELPVIVVHGDPHVEQFVTTADTYGLEDFDRSGLGPAVVDLVRYSASLHVTCADVSWPCDPNVAVERFLAAYRAALASAPEPMQPTVVLRLREKAPSNREPWLRWIDSLMKPLPPETSAEIAHHWQRFERLMSSIRPDLPATTFEVVRVGSLSMGFGSALERKLLFRVAGPSAAPEDDMVIEAREGALLASHACVWRPSYGESMVMMFNAVLSRRTPSIHGFVPLVRGARRFWVQEWDAGYVELQLSDIRSQSELEELAVDAARQLGGHLWGRYPASVLPYQLHAQREAFDATRARVETLARELGRETVRAWEAFRRDAR